MNSDQRLVFITISSELGGAERSLLDLVEHAKSHGPRKPLVVLPRTGPLEDLLKSKDIDTCILSLPSFYESVSRKNIFSIIVFLILGVPSYTLYYWRLHSFLEGIRPHSVHSTGIKNHILCCLLSLHTPWHYFVHLRDFIKIKPLVWFFRLFAKKKNIHWMSASQAITQNLKWHIPIFYDGLSEKVFYKNSSTDLKTSLGLSDRTQLIGHAAALTPWKGQMLFIEAASVLLNSHKDLHFVIIGSPIYKTNHDQNYDQVLKNKVADLGLEKNIHFVPFLKNSREIYDSLDVFVHCSLDPEPFGRVIVESVFCEKPTVAAKAGGVLEIFKVDGAKDLLHTPRDQNSLVSAIENALSFDPKCLEDLVHDVKTRFKAENCYKRQVDYLNESH